VTQIGAGQRHQGRYPQRQRQRPRASTTAHEQYLSLNPNGASAPFGIKALGHLGTSDARNLYGAAFSAAGRNYTPSLCAAEQLGAAWMPMLLGCTLPTREFPLFMLSFLTLGLSCLNRWTYRLAFGALWGQEKASIAPWRASLGLPPLPAGGAAAAIAALRPPILLACSSLVCGPRRALPVVGA
jgi:hypothetical protein